MLTFYDKEKRDISREMDQPTEFCDNPSCLGEPWCSAWEICSDEMTDTVITTVLEEEKKFSKEQYSQDSQDFCSNLPQTTASQAILPPTSSSVSTSNKRLFAAIKTDEEVYQARETGKCKKTKEDTKYCYGLWTSWTSYRESENGDKIGSIESLSRKQIQFWLTRFILEVRKRDGTEFPPNTLHHIVCGLMRHLRWNGFPNIDFFTDHDFTDLKKSLDAEMKRLQSKGLGSRKRQAEPLSQDEENTLWQKGFLGDKDPHTLLDTMIFCNGLYFALRSGREHRQLRLRPCQIELIENVGERPYLKYTEDLSKNRPGGIKGRKIKPKVVIHHANLNNSDRCFVRLFKKYIDKCPTSPEVLDAFYLQPSIKPTQECWYTTKPLGHNTLTKTIARLCTSAGIEGYKTNHSLRATTATRLYQSGIDEQLVMERTGHRSLEGVRSYKRTSLQQREALSDILYNKIPRLSNSDDTETSTSSSQQLVPCSSPLQTQSSTLASTTKKTSLPESFTFNSCSGITFNINY